MFKYTDNTELKNELKKAIIDNGTSAKAICAQFGASDNVVLKTM